MTEAEFLHAAGEAIGLDRPLFLSDAPDGTSEWDSVGHLSLLALIDEKFGIDASDDALTRPKTMGDLVAYLKSKNVLTD